MSWNTWLASMTKMEKLSEKSLMEMRDRLNYMISGYSENLYKGAGEALERYSQREIEKCREQMDRVETEIQRRGLR